MLASRRQPARRVRAASMRSSRRTCSWIRRWISRRSRVGSPAISRWHSAHIQRTSSFNCRGVISPSSRSTMRRRSVAMRRRRSSTSPRSTSPARNRTRRRSTSAYWCTASCCRRAGWMRRRESWIFMVVCWLLNELLPLTRHYRTCKRLKCQNNFLTGQSRATSSVAPKKSPAVGRPS